MPKALLDRDPELKRTIVAALGAAGLDWRRYEVGGADDSVNPATGLRENFFHDGGVGIDDDPQAEKPGTMSRELPPAVSPTGERAPRIRNDNWEYGHFGAKRRNSTGKYDHKGVDLEAPPGQPIRSPVSGTVEFVGDPYNDGRYQSIWVRSGDYRIGKSYVTPYDQYGNRLVKPGDKVAAGDVIGTMQDIAGKYKGMVNHVHLEVRRGKGREVPVDPAPWLSEWTK